MNPKNWIPMKNNFFYQEIRKNKRADSPTLVIKPITTKRYAKDQFLREEGYIYRPFVPKR